MYHALNLAVARRALFQKDGHDEALKGVLLEASSGHPTRRLAYWAETKICLRFSTGVCRRFLHRGTAFEKGSLTCQ